MDASFYQNFNHIIFSKLCFRRRWKSYATWRIYILARWRGKHREFPNWTTRMDGPAFTKSQFWLQHLPRFCLWWWRTWLLMDFKIFPYPKDKKVSSSYKVSKFPDQCFFLLVRHLWTAYGECLSWTTMGGSSCLHWWYHVFWFLWSLYRSSFEAYRDRLSNVLKRISHTGLMISSKKCNIYERNFKLLGHEVFENGFLVKLKQSKIGPHKAM